ncbi:hypothetical protein HMPREF1861_02053 [Corynebacterium kroppenstedtii]|nr:hypothetical protein HMPREF1861_02053 [Corynebacterium kroppenstedtii]
MAYQASNASHRCVSCCVNQHSASCFVAMSPNASDVAYFYPSMNRSPERGYPSSYRHPGGYFSS